MPAIDHYRARDRRDELDLDNAALAEMVGRSKKYVENVLYGIDEPSMRLAYRLERALDLPKGSLTAGKRTPQGDPSEPPIQPKSEPTHPPNRQDKEGGKKAPKRIQDVADVAGAA